MNIFDDVLYELPKNWRWVELSALLKEIRNGTTIEQNKSGKGFSVTRIESLQNQTIDFSRLGNIVNADEIREIDWYKPHDIVLSHINSEEHVGKTALITESMLPLVHGMNLLRLRFLDTLNPVYFQYYTQTSKYKDSIWRRMRRSVNQVSINQKLIGSIEIPLPPIAEQELIVKCLDSLFAKLDKAKAIAQKIVDGYKLRRGKILYDAFNIKDNFQEVKLSDVVLLISGQDLKSDQYNESKEGIPCIIGASSFDDNTGILINRWTTTPTVIVKKDDVLLTCKGTVGKTRIVDFDEAHIARQVMALRAKGNITNKFIYYFLQSQYNYLKRCEHGLIPGIKRENILSMDIKLPSIEEQKEIVRRLDSLLTKEQQTKEMAENVMNNIKIMKKKILGMAFRGELINPKSEGF